MAKLTTAEFIEAIKELSVLELNELVKACEEEFGVSAAAGVVVAAAGAGAPGNFVPPHPRRRNAAPDQRRRRTARRDLYGVRPGTGEEYAGRERHVGKVPCDRLHHKANCHARQPRAAIFLPERALHPLAAAVCGTGRGVSEPDDDRPLPGLRAGAANAA